MLPAGTPYVDAREGLSDLEAIEAVVVFDDIYPKRVGEITDVSSYESEVNNEDGTNTKATFYRFTDTGISFSKEYILEGQELKIKFESGKLNGMEFGVAFNPLGLPKRTTTAHGILMPSFGRLYRMKTTAVPCRMKCCSLQKVTSMYCLVGMPRR